MPPYGSLPEVVDALRAAGTPGSHLGQFYDADDFLCESVASFLRDGLDSGARAVVVATRHHRGGIAAHLVASGFDLGAALNNGTVTMLDADETLSAFVRRGELQDDLFRQHVGNVIAHLTRGGHQVRAFGEMVDLLWRDGRPAAALKLERLWNALPGRESLSILCGYSAKPCGDPDHERPFVEVCEEHSFVIAAESCGVRPGAGPAELLARMAQLSRTLELESTYRRQLEAALCQAISRNCD